MEQLTNCSIKTIEDATQASLSLLEKYISLIGIIVTLGSNGVFYIDNLTKTSTHIKSPNVNAIDTTVI